MNIKSRTNSGLSRPAISPNKPTINPKTPPSSPAKRPAARLPAQSSTSRSQTPVDTTNALEEKISRLERLHSEDQQRIAMLEKLIEMQSQMLSTALCNYFSSAAQNTVSFARKELNDIKALLYCPSNPDSQ